MSRTVKAKPHRKCPDGRRCTYCYPPGQLPAQARRQLQDERTAFDDFFDEQMADPDLAHAYHQARQHLSNISPDGNTSFNTSFNTKALEGRQTLSGHTARAKRAR